MATFKTFENFYLCLYFAYYHKNVHIQVILSTRKIFFRYRLVYDVRNTFLVACLLFVSFCHMNILRGRCCVFTIVLLTYSLLLRETELVFLVTKYLKHISAKMYRETFFLSPLLCELYEDHLDKCGFMFLGRDEEDNIKSHSGNEIQKFHYNREFASKRLKSTVFFFFFCGF